MVDRVVVVGGAADIPVLGQFPKTSTTKGTKAHEGNP